MKKVITLLPLAAALLVCPNLKAQHQPVKFSATGITVPAGAGKLLGATAFLRASAQNVRLPQQEATFTWNSANSNWDPNTHYSYTYHATGLRQSITEKDAPTEQHTFKTIEIVYDSQGRETHNIQLKRENNAWGNYSRNTYEYDEQTGERTAWAIDYWQEPNGWTLTHGGRQEITTNAQGQITQKLMQAYHTGTGWVAVEKYSYTYAGANLLPVAYTKQEKINDAWLDTERVSEIVYDNETVTGYVVEAYDQTLQKWAKGRLSHTYTTDATNQTATTVSFYEYFEDATWKPSRKDTFHYLTDESLYLGPMLFLESSYEFYSPGSGWQKTVGHKATYTRDTNGYITEAIIQSYNPQDNSFRNQTRTLYSDFINLTVTNTNDNALALATEVYPNPAQNSLRISLDAGKVRNATLSIYSLAGQRVHEQHSLQATTTVDISSLPKGVYLVKISDDRNAAATRRIVKQ